MKAQQPHIRYEQPDPHTSQWCETHQMEVNGWHYEDAYEGYICGVCYSEHWQAEDAELWGDETPIPTDSTSEAKVGA